ncbi:MAG: DUF1552 domain-containing protein [Myxococcota bacterium]
MSASAPILTDETTLEDRLEAQFELAAAALICGLTHVVTIAAAAGDRVHVSYPRWGFTGKHTIGHGNHGGADALIQIHNHHAELIGRMMDRLDAVPEGDGTMLDNTLIVYLNDNGSEHHSKYDNFPVAVIGTLGGRLQAAGRRIAYPKIGKANNRGLPELWNTIAHAVGMPMDDFGAEGEAPSDGPLPELLA